MPAPTTELYNPLPSDRHIRLLSLASDAVAKNDVLHCTFIEHSLDDTIPWAGYCALSYVWGSSLYRVEIVCSERRCHITWNLFSALRRIWKTTPRQLLWADALCINQTDDQEKAQQVSLMGTIYRSASAVLIWLGEDDPGRPIAKLWKEIENNS